MKRWVGNPHDDCRNPKGCRCIRHQHPASAVHLGTRTRRSRVRPRFTQLSDAPWHAPPARNAKARSPFREMAPPARDRRPPGRHRCAEAQRGGHSHPAEWCCGPGPENRLGFTFVPHPLVAVPEKPHSRTRSHPSTGMSRIPQPDAPRTPRNHHPHTPRRPLQSSPVAGAWLSLAEHLVRDQGVAGSNPAAPTRPVPPRTG